MDRRIGIPAKSSQLITLFAGLAALLFLSVLCASCTNPQASLSTSHEDASSASLAASSSEPSSLPQAEAIAEASSMEASIGQTSSEPVASSTPRPASSSSDAYEELLFTYFLDVDQGDCAIVSCNGHHLLIDGGPPAASHKVFATIKDLGIDNFDAIIVTHSDADHTGSVSAALNAAGCNVCYCPVETGDSETFRSMLTYLEKRNCGITVPTIPLSFDLGGATVNLIGPTRTFDNDNDNSIVCRIEYGNTALLFMGDAEMDAERALLNSGAVLEANVLKVGHHGSSKSTSKRFLDAVNPGAAVISVGTGNDYGHPTQSTLNRLSTRGIEVLRTDLDGEIVAVSDGQTVSLGTTKENLVTRSLPDSQADGGEISEPASGTEGNQATEEAAALAAAQQQREGDAPYIGNRNSMKFHHAWCSSVGDMSEKNKVFFTSREEAIEAEYVPCKRCTP